jgi:hypothetical protein
LHDTAGRQGFDSAAFKPQKCTPIAGKLHPVQAVSADVQTDKRRMLSLKKRNQRIRFNLKELNYEQLTPY